MRKVVPIAIGLVFGLFCLLWAILLGGAGHGWVSAFLFGALSLVLFPLAFYNWFNFKLSSRKGSINMLLVAAVLDVALFFATRSEGMAHFNRVASAAWSWIGYWSIWQLVVLRTAFIAPTSPRPFHLTGDEKERSNVDA
jgi:hypothetical protein